MYALVLVHKLFCSPAETNSIPNIIMFLIVQKASTAKARGVVLLIVILYIGTSTII